ncbi:MAG: hypothetical protein RIT03_853 [Bacteroidota bacterium]|jgi:hypothetical protein
MLEKVNLENSYCKLENHARGLTSSNFISCGSRGYQQIYYGSILTFLNVDFL